MMERCRKPSADGQRCALFAGHGCSCLFEPPPHRALFRCSSCIAAIVVDVWSPLPAPADVAAECPASCPHCGAAMLREPNDDGSGIHFGIDFGLADPERRMSA